MTRDIPAGSIVVGTDGSAHAERAVVWAARQAHLEGRPLDIVHAYGRVGVGELAWLGTPGLDQSVLTRALHEAGETLAAEAREIAVLEVPGLEVRTHVLGTDARDALVEASASAHVVVLGSRGRGPLRSLVLGSVSQSVARLARCPVVVCRPQEPHDGRHEVLVGAEGSVASLPVVEFAFQQASLHHLPLVVMHSFVDPTLVTQGAAGVQAEPSDVVELRMLLSESVAGLGEKYPDVEVDLQLSQGLVDQCLLHEAPEAELVVVGRSDVSGWSRLLYSSCALAVLERARTTVVVVPEQPAE
ncbi:universal stress protein [Nocardioides sp.]|uniref:universal stress protein n=1 Tax=Nocardioides sp. TaxID=35761 RepID=UPI001A197835|nr:universal stress protein [Nocardioides sp.]MBJ7356767.1 universal stress protein [Nocardioides sp.]